MSSSSNDLRLAAAQRLLPYHIHLVSDLWHAVPPGIAESFPDPFAPARLAAEKCARLPAALLTWWASLSSGHLLITARTSGYTVGLLPDEQRPLYHVAQIGLPELRYPAFYFWVAHLLDHHLGTGGTEAGPWLSEGGGLNSRWQAVGQRIHQLAGLGYGQSAAAQGDPHVYFAEGLVRWLHDRRTLNVQDPKLARLLHTSILDEGFCRRSLR